MLTDLDILQKCLSKNKPLSAYRLPNATAFQVLIQDSSQLRNAPFPHKAKGFLVAPFSDRESVLPSLIQPDLLFSSGNDLSAINRQLEKISSAPPFETIAINPVTNRLEYQKQFDSFQQAFRDQGLQKAILSRVHRVEKPKNFDLADTFLKLTKTYPTAFVYLLQLPGVGTWMGATPELLLRENSGTWETVSLAGTQPAQADPGTIQWGEKEREEQAMVSRFIRAKLMEEGVFELSEAGPETVRAGNVAHLKTRFSFSGERLKWPALAKLLHPTPAVSGLPQQQALSLIYETEPHQRNYYAGYLGPIGLNNQTALFVNLRCMQIHNNCLDLYVGGGLTADSDAQKEWDETLHKANTLLGVL